MKTDREKDGWLGPVKSVVTEMAPFTKRAGHWVLNPRTKGFATTYDRDGRKTTESFGSDVLFSAGHPNDTINKSDDEGHVIEQEKYQNGTLQYRVFFTYDAEGRETERTVCSPDGTLLTSTIHKYDAHGKAIEMSVYKSDGSVDHKISYTNTYDSKGNLIEVTAKRSNNDIHDSTGVPLFVIYHSLTYY
jgi:antitoxin component YwqK of YwqJK toxin-antitoxin module